MKKILLMLLITVGVILTGCNKFMPVEQQEKPAKSSRIQIYSTQNHSLLATIESPKTVGKLIHTDEWEQTDTLPQNLNPQYELIVYQEKTRLQGEPKTKEKEYELIERITTYEDTLYVEEAISPDVIKNMKVPEEFLTLYYTVPQEMMNELQQLLK